MSDVMYSIGKWKSLTQHKIYNIDAAVSSRKSAVALMFLKSRIVSMKRVNWSEQMPYKLSRSTVF
jgi:hypothetical protein